MIQVLIALDCKLDVENRKVLLFLDNAPPHPENPPGKPKKHQASVLPKNTTSKLQPCEAGIIRNLKIKYRKQLLKHLISRVDYGKKASEIIQGVDLLQCMRWMNQAFEQITKDIIKHCFEKCGFSEVSLLAEDPDEEFEDLLKSLTIDVMPDENASFDDDVDTSEMSINVQKKCWEDILRKQCIEKVNADPDEIDISSDDSNLEGNNHIEAIEEENLRYHLLVHCRCSTSYKILLPLSIQNAVSVGHHLLKSYKT